MSGNRGKRNYYKTLGVFHCEFCLRNRDIKVSIGLAMQGCGCRQSRITHGLSGSPVYLLWKRIISRCYNIKSHNSKWYGRRGIGMCDEWRRKPESFALWANTHGYRPGITIDRIDPGMDYSPENCRFVTLSENCRWTSQTKLDWDKVREIRELYDSTKKRSQRYGKVKELAQRFGITTTSIHRAGIRKSWIPSS